MKSTLQRSFTRKLFPFVVGASALFFMVLQVGATIGTSLQMQLGNPSSATTDTNNHDHYLIQRTVEALDYSDNLGEPTWASWDLTSADVGSASRSTSFFTDDTLPSNFYHVTTGDYTGSGYDRGHLCPSADRTDTRADNDLVFYMSNIMPQSPDNNQGPWEVLETYCRTLASSGNELLITCGPSTFDGSRIQPSGKVSIPGYTWKIIVVVPPGGGSALSRITSTTRVIAVKVPNIAGIRSVNWTNYNTTANQIQADTGYTFFTALDPAIASVLRAKNDAGGSTPPSPSITSFSPTSGPVGTSVVITGSNLTGASFVRFNGTDASSFTVNSDTQVTATVPTGATTGTISITTAGGIATSSGSFTVTGGTPVPSITSFSPTSGAVGTSVTITGANFTGATAVTFNGTSASSFTVNSDTQITATVPTGATTGTISVTTAGGTGNSSSSFTVTGGGTGKVVISQIYGGGGNSGATYKNDFIELYNSGGSSVDLSSYAVQYTSATGTSWSETTLSGSIAPGHYYLVQEAAGAGGTQNLPTPDATGTISMSATAAKVALTSTTTLLSGSNPVGGPTVVDFVGYGSTANAFEGSGPAPAPSNTTSDLRANGGATDTDNNAADFATGAVNPRNSSTGGSSAPTITSFSPTSGGVGASVTITGTAFTGATAVKFNGTTATFTVNSDTQITATVPSGATTGTISVTTAGGTATSASSFTVIPAPSITSFSPTSGAVGASVTITGTAFTGATAVKFNGTTATFTVNSDAQITATVPTGATTGTISVTTAGGTATSASSFTVIPPPTITSFSPTSGAVGASVTITGTAFTGATVVKFNGTTATFTVNSDTQITATVPTGATTGTINVTTAGGTGTSASSFTVIPPPTITSFSPTSGAVGASVTITGTAFTSATAVKFNGTTATFIVNSDTQITTTVPTGATTGTISVSNPGGTATSASSFTLILTPSITSFSPTSGAIGASVTITGTAFTGATAVKFNGTTATFTVNSDTQITAAVPSGATTGTISVTTAGGTGTSASSFTVIPPPTITSFSPTSGAVGASVTITGTAFTGATAVKFNGTTATFTVNSATQITATVPTGATTGTISVTTPGGTATSASSFTVVSPPTITSFSPTSGAIGASVTITGTAFTGATAVKFNGTNASFTVNSATQITATVPTGATTGTISVTTPGGTATSASSFTVTTGVGVVVISQVYGGGGNSGATYKNDFIELYNKGTASVNLSTYAVQYASASGSTWQETTLTGSLAAGHYYLIQEAQGAGGTQNLPTPEATGTISMSATAGKVALTKTQTLLTVDNPLGNTNVVDFIGYGTADVWEGSGAAPAPSNTTADLRANGGATDTNNNAADFTTGAPNPRN